MFSYKQNHFVETWILKVMKLKKKKKIGNNVNLKIYLYRVFK